MQLGIHLPPVHGPLRVKRHQPRLAICYKNFAAHHGISHIGLGVSATQTARYLRTHGYIVEIWPINSAADLALRLQRDAEAQQLAHHIPVSHVSISAPWIPTNDLAQLAFKYPEIEFAVVSHSNVGFLQADPRAIELLRQGAELAHGFPHFHIAGNSEKFVTWWDATYGGKMLLLENLYPIEHHVHSKHWRGGLLRIGCFCAVRPYKNVLTAAAAALEVSQRLRVSDMEFWMSGGRMEGGGGTIQKAIEQMYRNVPRAKVVTNNWQSWPSFLSTVGSMDLMIQPSYTEAFNMVTADGIAQGVSSVVSDAIAWAPANWKAESDSASDMADRAIALLHDPNSAERGLRALETHNLHGFGGWRSFLELHP